MNRDFIDPPNLPKKNLKKRTVSWQDTFSPIRITQLNHFISRPVGSSVQTAGSAGQSLVSQWLPDKNSFLIVSICSITYAKLLLSSKQQEFDKRWWTGEHGAANERDLSHMALWKLHTTAWESKAFLLYIDHLTSQRPRASSYSRIPSGNIICFLFPPRQWTHTHTLLYTFLRLWTFSVGMNYSWEQM